MNGDPRIPRQLMGIGQARSDGGGHVKAADPLGWCVIATTALLTWIIGPVVVALFAAVGFVIYLRAWRSGRQDSQCILGDIRLVLLYLAVLAAVGTVATVTSFL